MPVAIMGDPADLEVILEECCGIAKAVFDKPVKELEVAEM